MKPRLNFKPLWRLMLDEMLAAARRRRLRKRIK
jgi:hypothetical protein